MSIVLFTAGATLTPGPTNTLVMSSASQFGIKRSMPVFLGSVLGFPSLLFAAGLGLDAVLKAFPQVFLFLKFIGAGYICVLAWRIANIGELASEKQVDKPLTFLHGVAFHWVNPKSWIVGLSAISSFSIPALSQLMNTSLISLVFVSVALPCVGIWMVAGSALRRILNTRERVLWFNRVLAVLLVVSVLNALVS